jgi:hypothetical protein
MSTLTNDPNGYYALLGVAPDASLAAIKTAYRARVKAVHPDHNDSPHAKGEFQRLTTAYAVLRDHGRRAEYDVTGQAGTDDDDVPPAAPYACCRCGRMTAQPRYTVFRQVKSYLVWAKTTRIEGIFCRDCADREATRASTASWAWGWWSPPGLVLTPLALIGNLLGGAKPAGVNARLLIRQAGAFLADGKPDLAHAVALQAQTFVRDPVQRQQVADLLRRTAGHRRRLKTRWRPWTGKAFLPQLAPLVVLPVTIALVLMVAAKPWADPMIGASARIVVQQPQVGAITHVAVDALKLRQAPGASAPVLTLLDRFTTVTTVGRPHDPAWSQIRAPSGLIGFVRTDGLYGGSGTVLRRDWCEAHRGTMPDAGEVLLLRASGNHQIFIHNPGLLDAVVKLKTRAGDTVASYYVPGTYDLSVGGIPEGTYYIDFATGRDYSRGCGMFMKDMHAAELPFALTLRHVSMFAAPSFPATIPEISLVTPAGDPRRPIPIGEAAFLNDH